MQGHKRWDKAVVSGLENLRDLVHQNMIPALERCGIILSRLLGLASFHEPQDNIGFTGAQIAWLMDVVTCLLLVSHKILLVVMDELELFTAFSSWLRLEIDKLVSSTLSEELSEKEATMDNGRVLQYIQRYLAASPLALYLDKVGKEDWAKDLDVIDGGPALLDLLDQQLQKRDTGAPYMAAFPNVHFLVDYLSARAGVVFNAIAEAERRSVRFGRTTKLDIASPVSRFDVHMTAVPKTVRQRHRPHRHNVLTHDRTRRRWTASRLPPLPPRRRPVMVRPLRYPPKQQNVDQTNSLRLSRRDPHGRRPE